MHAHIETKDNPKGVSKIPQVRFNENQCDDMHGPPLPSGELADGGHTGWWSLKYKHIRMLSSLHSRGRSSIQMNGGSVRRLPTTWSTGMGSRHGSGCTVSGAMCTCFQSRCSSRHALHHVTMHSGALSPIPAPAQLLRLTSCDTPEVLALAPRVLQALIAAGCDLCIARFAAVYFDDDAVGKDVLLLLVRLRRAGRGMRWDRMGCTCCDTTRVGAISWDGVIIGHREDRTTTPLCGAQATNWFSWYCATRTYSSTAEAAALCALLAAMAQPQGLSFSRSRSQAACVGCLAALAVGLRPTAAVHLPALLGCAIASRNQPSGPSPRPPRSPSSASSPSSPSSPRPLFLPSTAGQPHALTAAAIALSCGAAVSLVFVCVDRLCYGVWVSACPHLHARHSDVHPCLPSPSSACALPFRALYHPSPHPSLPHPHHASPSHHPHHTSASPPCPHRTAPLSTAHQVS